MEKMKWGDDPEFLGPKHWFRQSLIIREILKQKRSGTILDFGCGSGTLLVRLSLLGFKGVGIDLSKKAIEYFKLQIKHKNLNNKLTAESGNEKLLLSKRYSNRFDIISASEILEHLKDEKNAIQGFYHALKKGGFCIVTVPAHQYLWDINDDFSSHFRRYEKEKLIELFEKEGFKIKKTYYFGFPLSLIWHRKIFLPLIRRKIKAKIQYTKSKNLLGYLLSFEIIKKTIALPFWFDQLFNWTQKGGSLLLIARKT